MVIATQIRGAPMAPTVPEFAARPVFHALRLGYPTPPAKKFLRNAPDIFGAALTPFFRRGVTQLRTGSAASCGRIVVITAGHREKPVSTVVPLGVSPRGAQALYRATQALATWKGRITPFGRRKAPRGPVFAHRVRDQHASGSGARSSDLSDRIPRRFLRW